MHGGALERIGAAMGGAKVACHERSYLNVMQVIAVAVDAASLNFLANEWLETHTPSFLNHFIP